MRITTLLFASVIVATSANAAQIYNNGPPTVFGGNETVFSVLTEDFSFTSATTVTGAGVYLAGFGGIVV